MTYQVKLDVFNGPLDLLLYLVNREQLDITDISLAKVADQYFAYLQDLKASVLDLDTESNYLVVFACLLEIKSRLLLPLDPEEPGPEDFDLERDTEEYDLVARLKEYKRFKEASLALQDRERESLRMFPRAAPDDTSIGGDVPADETLSPDVSLPDLLGALRSLLNNVWRRKKAEQRLRLHRVAVSVPERMEEILSKLSANGEVGHRADFFELFENEVTRPHIIVTFLAILELARLRRIRLWQESMGEGTPGRGVGALSVELVEARKLSSEETSRLAPAGRKSGRRK